MDEKDLNINGALNEENSIEPEITDKNTAEASEKPVDDFIDISFKKDPVPIPAQLNFLSDEQEAATDSSENVQSDVPVEDEAEDTDFDNEDAQNLEPLQESTEESYTEKPKKAADKKKSRKKKKKKKKKKKSGVNSSIFGGLILVTIILVVSVVVAIGAISLGMEYTGIGKNDDEVTFEIPKNATTDDIAQILVDNQIIENRTLFKIAMKLKSPATIFPGTITLHASMGYASIIDELATMRESYETVTLTFTEGSTLLDIANMLQENNVCSAEDFLFEFNKTQGYSFEDKVDTDADSFYKMEGFAFPDTYEFYVEDTAYNVTKTIREHFESKITDSMYETMEENGMTLSEVITLASIVQWEANSVEDMPKVASVFINRLNDSDTFPSLQSDATKRYITNVIEVAATDDTSISHYTDCYDTYVCTGLPAGPVCNPGLDAINAVLYPDETKYYYFCNNLETGKSYFAETLEEHTENLKLAGLA